MKRKALDLLKLNHQRKEVVLSTVSGILTTEPGMIRHFAENVPSCDMITTKSYQLRATLGHREPVICSPSDGTYGNFVGLRNPGLDTVLTELENIRKEHSAFILNVSLAANSIEDFILAIGKVAGLADIVELNFSCPHADSGFGASIGADPDVAGEYVRRICGVFKQRDFLIIPKLTPNAKDIAAVAKAVIDAGADGVALINTMGPYEYADPASGEIIFNRREGGKGGMSGARVKETALDCIRKVRAAIGDDPVVLGMGGVSTPLDVRQMLEAGADSVGIGSALASIDFYSYEKYFKALKLGRDVSSLIRTPYARMQYREHELLAKEEIGNGCVRLTLSGSISCSAGEFVFLWIPQVGEKPFSVSTVEPLTFVVKRRGEFTNAICDAKVGSKIFSRGPYGKPVELVQSERALLIAGGSGMAVLPLIAERVSKVFKDIRIKVALTGDAPESGKELAGSDFLSKYGPVDYVYDAGVLGRVIGELSEKDVQGDVACYVVGPTVMMNRICERLCSLGADPDKVFMSVESLTLCGIGMCGECYCAGRLPCKEGTFYKYSEMRSRI